MFTVAVVLTAVAALVAVAALARRDQLADRLLSLEVAIVATAATVTIALPLGASGRFVDLVLILGLVGFTSTLAGARYLEHRNGGGT